MKKFILYLFFSISCLISYATTQQELSEIAVKFLNEKGFSPKVENNVISWMDSGSYNEIQIVPVENLFIVLMVMSTNIAFEEPKSKDFSEKLLMVSQLVQSEVPLIKLSLSSLKGGDLALLNGGSPEDILGYSGRYNIQNLISDSKMFKEALPLFYNLIITIPESVKNIVESL